MNAATRHGLAKQFATATGRTIEVPFPGTAYLSKRFDTVFAANRVDAMFSFAADGQCVAFVRPGDEASLAALAAALEG